jgi:type IV pilus assembly protein PilE
VRKTESGVTLVELLTVVMIVAILGAIAVPSYRGYVLRANRSEAKTALLATAAALERCFTRNLNYQPNVTGCQVTFPVTSESGHYQITSNLSSPWSAFTLTATPQGRQAQDTGCGDLTLDNLNTRGKSGTKTVAECWGK